MSPRPLQLEGQVSDNGPSLSSLRLQLEDVARELRAARARIEELEQELRIANNIAIRKERAVAAIRIQLNPLYQGLREFYGEMEEFDPSEGPAMFGGKPKGNYEKWKQRFPGKTAAVIEALESHPMSRDQVRVATASGWSTVDECLKKLRDIGLISKNGAGKWALKEL